MDVKTLRETKGYSQETLAGLLGISRSTVARWEAGESQPRKHLIVRLEELFGSAPEVEANHPSGALEEAFEALAKYEQAIADTSSVAEMKASVQRFIRQLGIDYFLYMQVFRGDIDSHPQVFVSTDIEQQWQAFYRDNYFGLYDPVWQHCWTKVSPVTSDEVYQECKRKNDRRSMEVMHQYWNHGYAFYIAIPIHGPCCMSVFSVTVKDPQKKALVQKLSPVLMAAGKALYSQVHVLLERRFKSCRRPQLRPVDRDLMVHLLQGNSVKVIASDFGISESAVRQRVDRLQLKLNVTNRQELSLLVVAQGLSLQDAMRYSARADLFDSHVLRRTF